MDEKCLSVNCFDHKKYKKSSNYKVLNSTSKISYTSGSLEGEIGTDNLIIGNYFFEDMPFHLVNKLEINIFENSPWDGLIGLGYIQEKRHPKDVGMSIIDRFKKLDSCKEKIFSYFL